MGRYRLRISRWEMFRAIVAQAALIGLKPGALSGLACAVIMSFSSFEMPSAGVLAPFVTSLVFASAVGSLIGALLGFAAGIVVAIESCVHFLPPYDTRKYRRIVTIQCVAVTMSLGAAAVRIGILNITEMHATSIAGVCIATFLSALWGSKKLAAWYGEFSELSVAVGVSTARAAPRVVGGE